MKRDKDIGGFLGETIEVAATNIAAILIYVVVIGGVTISASLLGFITESDGELFGYQVGYEIPVLSGAATGLAGLALVILTFVVSYFVIAKMLESLGRRRNNDMRLLAYVGLTILTMIGFLFGFLLLVVPGIILLVRWSAAPSFLIGAGKGVIESLGASWEATSGYGWAIFFAGLILFVGFAILAGIFGYGFSSVGGAAITTSVSAIIDAISSALSLAFGVAIYNLVHDDSEAIGEVFQ
ncbi:MAG: hypothetical protein EP341_08970 [Sphingomonadales bacterium]|nr:MAG: hypothetical protein EP341_08970 [Sphingomonadales bacterium]